MRTSIQRRGKRWSVRYDLPTSRDGRRRQRRCTVGGTRREAEAVAARILEDLRRGTYADVGRTTLLSHVLKEWLSECAYRVELKTYERYRSIVDLHIVDALGSVRLRDLGPGSISEALTDWMKQARKDGRPGALSPTSVNHIFRTLSTALNFAVRRGYLAKNPCQAILPPPRVKSDRPIITLDALHTLLGYADDDSFRTAIITAIGTGLRCAELVALRWKDIDFENGLLHAWRAATVKEGVLTEKKPKTQRSRRTLALPGFVLSALSVLRNEQSARYEQLALPAQNEETPVFETCGASWKPGNFSCRFYRAVKRAGIDKCRLHDLRHTFASLLLASGIDLKVVSDALGHSTISTTANLYVHIVPALKASAANRLDVLFAGRLASQH